MRFSIKNASLVGLAALGMPFLAFAQNATLQPIGTLLSSLLTIINTLVIPLLIAAAIVVFFYGLVKYIWGAGGEDAHEQGRRVMIAGIVSLVIMLALYGIVYFFSSALGINTSVTFTPPSVTYGSAH